VAGELLAGLVDRGLDFNDFNEPRIHIPDGGKAPNAARGSALVN
jgi:hypothetical protein